MKISKPQHAVIEKIKAMYGKRITEEQYDDMIRCRNVPDVASYLKNATSYQRALEGLPESNIHRGQLEHLLHRKGFARYMSLYYYLPESKNTLFRFMLRAKEISVLLSMMLWLKAGNPQNSIAELPGYFLKHATVDLLAIANAKNFTAFVEALQGSDYERVLRPFVNLEHDQLEDYVGCEYAMYQDYYKRIFRMIANSYDGEERRALQEFFKLQTEMANIEHIVRSRQLPVPREQVVQSLFPYHYRLSRQQLSQMLDMEDFAAIKQFLLQTRYRDKFSAGEEYLDVEGYTRRYFSRYCRHALQFSPYASVVFFSYYNLHQLELSNITTVIETIRYQLPPDQIKLLLIS